MKFLKKALGVFFMFIALIYITATFNYKDNAYITLPIAIVFTLLSLKLLNIKVMSIFKIIDKKQLNQIRKERDFLQSECVRLSAISYSIKSHDALSLNQILNDLNREKCQIEIDCQNKSDELQNIKNSIESLNKQKSELEQTIKLYYFQSNNIEYGIYEPRYKFITSSAYKTKLDEIRQKQSDLIKSDYAVEGFKNWNINGNKRKGKQMINKTIKLMLRAFNGECDASIYKVKYNNFSTIEKRIRKSFDDINKMNSEIQLSISINYLDLKIQELHLAYEYELKIQEEKEILREQREKDREERALQKEIEAKRQKIAKEVAHINNAINSLKEKLQNATDEEKENIKKTISELQNSINDYEEQQKELDYRIENVGAGYVYIISNIGAFGENVFKIGVTRRLEPLERISELSSASVPFKFDVHALIFSYKAYELETALHKRFEKNRINLVNNRKEFFKVDINEIEKELEKYKDLTIEFTKQADAEEYRETLSILRANSKTV
ncbi:MAG: DUF4041 domain-containing protein [Peptoanaerobacter stomatis]|uniref:DUF4041 domain-containing protein n=1 Tax=Peptoanaerobacter stomatis TaxID=796937 RepID=UPI003F9F9C00